MGAYLKNLLFIKNILISIVTLTISFAVSADDRIPISTVTHITVPGSYVLTNNIEAAAYSSGLFIDSSNVTIDLNGFTISHTGAQTADGISIGSARNVEIYNGTIKGFTRYGIFVIGDSNPVSADIKFRNLHVVENGYGVNVQPTGVVVDSCVISRNGGLGLRLSGAGLVVNNMINNNGYGFYGSSAVGYLSNVISGNTTSQVSGTPTNLGKNLCGTVLCP